MEVTFMHINKELAHVCIFMMTQVILNLG